MAFNVSVCVPAYNNPIDVDRLLSSLVRQSYQDFAVFLADDSDNNAVRSVVERFASGPLRDRIHYVKNEVKQGFVMNWNVPLRMADGDYIKIMFSDDFFTTDYSLDAFVRLLDNHPDASLAFSGSRETILSDNPAHPAGSFHDRAASQEFVDALSRNIYHLFYSNLIGAPSATIYRRKPVMHFFDERSGFASDVFLYLDILKDNPCFAWTKDPLVSIGLHGAQYTETFSDYDERKYDDYKYMLNKYNLYQDKDIRSYFLKEYILPFKKTLAEAKTCHVSTGSYLLAYLKWKLEGIQYYLTKQRNQS